MPTDAPGKLRPLVNEGRREYLCDHCGTFLFRARGPCAPVTIVLPCRNRNCRLQNEVALNAAQQVGEAQRQQWARVRASWRNRQRNAA